MNILECPEKYKQYRVTMSNESEYIIDGETKKNIIDSKGNWVELKDGSVINKAFIVEFKLDFHETKVCVYKNREKLEESIIKGVLNSADEKKALKDYTLINTKYE